MERVQNRVHHLVVKSLGAEASERALRSEHESAGVADQRHSHLAACRVERVHKVDDGARDVIQVEDGRVRVEAS